MAKSLTTLRNRNLPTPRSPARYIHLHGLADQTTIGRPASCGCIHLADTDLIWLFDGTLVRIADQ